MTIAGEGRVRRPSDVVAELSGVLLSKISELADRLVGEILKLEPSYTSINAVPRDDLWRSCHDNLDRIIEALRLGGELEDGFFDAPRATGTRRADQGFPLESLLHAYRLGGRVIWEGLVEEARSRDRAEVDSLLDGATHVWELIDTFSSVVADAYRRRELELLRLNEHRSQALIDGLIEGSDSSPAFITEAAAALDLPEDGRFCVVCVEVADDGRDVLQKAARELSFGGLRSVWRLRPDREVGLIALGQTTLDQVGRALEPLSGGRIGISPVVDGLARVAVAYRFAGIALRTLPPGSSGLAMLDRRLPSALLVGQGELGERLAGATLGPVLELDPDTGTTLLDTLDVYFANGGSAARAAERMYCHRNTILNRLRRVESLTGLVLSDPAHVVQLYLALHAVKLSKEPRLAVR